MNEIDMKYEELQQCYETDLRRQSTAVVRYTNCLYINTNWKV